MRVLPEARSASRWGALSPTRFLEESQKRWSRGTQSTDFVPWVLSKGGALPEREAQVPVSLCVMQVHT